MRSVFLSLMKVTKKRSITWGLQEASNAVSGQRASSINEGVLPKYTGII